MAMDTQHTIILKRVGVVLLAVGLIDIAIMIYCIANRISYSSSFNIFAVVAGIFLLRGSLRAASIVRWFAVFMLAVSATVLLVCPLIQPPGLILTYLRLNSGMPFVALALMVCVPILLLCWVVMELGRESVKCALAGAGRKQRDMRIPAAMGVGLVIIIAMAIIFMATSFSSESVSRAKFLAEQQVGSGYRLHMKSLNKVKKSERTFVFGVVTAWSDNEIRNILVQWEER
jgi:hypothetical protein